MGHSGDGSVTRILTSLTEDGASTVEKIKCYNKSTRVSLLCTINIPTSAFLLILNALCADRPLSSGGFLRIKLVARFDFGVACTTNGLSSSFSDRLLSDCKVPLGVTDLRCNAGDAMASSTASWCLRKKL